MSTEDLLKSALTNPSEDIARAILKAAGASPDSLAKAVTTADGLVAFDLQAPAKSLYPVSTPIRNRLPRVRGKGGTATNWRAVTSIIGSGFDNTGWVPEGQRAGQMSIATDTVAASYATLGEETGLTFEAESAAEGFEDEMAKVTMRLLQKMFLKEEMALLGGNASVSLGTPATPTASAAGTGATLPAATYSVICVALTFEGFRNSSLAGGVATAKTVTGADGNTYVINGGASNKSAAASQAITLGQVLSASVTSVQGAMGYAWFVGTAGSEVLQKITTINSATFSAPLATGTQPATAVTADYSKNATAYDGLFTSAAKSGSGAYYTDLATGVAGTGTSLTASGRGSVVEIDAMFESMWDQYQVSPSVLYVNSQEIKSITDKVLSNASGPLLQVYKSPEEAYQLTAGGTIQAYYNPFQLEGGQRIPVKIHPYVPPGTILGWAENLPAQYQSSEVPNVAEVHTRRDYYQINWPITTRQRQAGVYAEEVLAVYFPPAMGVISNIAAG